MRELAFEVVGTQGQGEIKLKAFRTLAKATAYAIKHKKDASIGIRHNGKLLKHNKEGPPFKNPVFPSTVSNRKVLLKGHGQLSIFRDSNALHEGLIFISLGAFRGKTELITMKVKLEDFTKALTGLGVPVNFEVIKKV